MNELRRRIRCNVVLDLTKAYTLTQNLKTINIYNVMQF